MARTSAKDADKVTDARRPYIRHPYERVRVAVSYDPESGLTHQSFKDECDINNIVAQYARTGIAPRTRLEPQYGDAPDAGLFEAACVQAELRSLDEMAALNPESPETASEAPEGEITETLGDTLGEEENSAEKRSEAVPPAEGE